MRCRARCFLTLALLLVGAGEAHAKECANPLVNTCINSETYWPNAGPMHFLTVGTTLTLARGQFGFGLVGSYVSRPVVLRVASPGPGGSDQFVVNDQVNGNFLFAYGVTDRLQLDFALPTTFIQTGAGTSPLTGGADLPDTAVRDVRMGFAYALVTRERVDATHDLTTLGARHRWALTGRFTMSAPTGDADAFAGERTAVLAPSLAGDYRNGRFFAGADVGVRMRPVTEFAGARVGTQLTTGLGAGVDVLDRERLAVFVEARSLLNFPEQHDTVQSAFGISSRPNGKTIVPAEWLLGVRTAPLLGGDISFLLGGGGPIPTGDPAITVPRFRFLLGAVYAPAARDADGDGIPDKDDACPTERGVRGGDRSGCPQVTDGGASSARDSDPAKGDPLPGTPGAAPLPAGPPILAPPETTQPGGAERNP